MIQPCKVVQAMEPAIFAMAALLLGAAFIPSVSAADPHVTATAPASADSRAARRTPVVEVFEASKDAVVNISSTQIVEIRSPWDRFFDMPGMEPGRLYKQTSVGSGFVIHPAGYIVTNAHVVARTADRKVIFADKRELPAQLVALDQERDLAVLKVESNQPLKTLKLGRSSDLMVGETVIAIGDPMGYQHTVTAGVVSALNRDIATENDDSGRQEFHGLRGLIQTDASINLGNSGGPLLNVLGELIGINTAIRGDAQNIGFAIPVDHLRSTLPELLDVERRYHIVMGLTLSDDGTTRVTEVKAGSPADQAGLKVGDIVTSVNQEPVGSGIDYHIALIGHKAGDVLALVVKRGTAGDTSTTLKLGERPRPDGARLLSQRLGIVGQPLTEKMARAMGMQRLKGFLVESVEAKSSAERAGLQRGDVVIQLGTHQADSLDDLGELLEKVTPGQGVQVAILRLQGNAIFRLGTVIEAR